MTLLSLLAHQKNQFGDRGALNNGFWKGDRAHEVSRTPNRALRTQNSLASRDQKMKSSVPESNANHALFKSSRVQQLVFPPLRACVHAHRSSCVRGVA